MERQTISNAHQCERRVLKSQMIYEKRVVLCPCSGYLPCAASRRAFLSAGSGMNYNPGQAPTATKCLPMFLCSAGLSTLEATGRNPNTEGLGLELTGVELTDR
jgi:hypothetical protein